MQREGQLAVGKAQALVERVLQGLGLAGGRGDEQGVDAPRLAEDALEGLEVEVCVQRPMLMRLQAEVPRAPVGQDAGEHRAHRGDNIAGSAAAKQGFAVGRARAFQREQHCVA